MYNNSKKESEKRKRQKWAKIAINKKRTVSDYIGQLTQETSPFYDSALLRYNCD